MGCHGVARKQAELIEHGRYFIAQVPDQPLPFLWVVVKDETGAEQVGSNGDGAEPDAADFIDADIGAELVRWIIFIFDST